MLSGHEKINIGVFAKRFEKINKILLALKQKQTTAQLTVQHLTDIESACRGIKLLPGSLSASGHAAAPLSFDISNGQTVYNYTLYEKKENEKAVPKHFNGFERTTCEKARASI